MVLETSVVIMDVVVEETSVGKVALVAATVVVVGRVSGDGCDGFGNDGSTFGGGKSTMTLAVTTINLQILDLRKEDCKSGKSRNTWSNRQTWLWNAE